MKNIAIIGGGPAGFMAGICAAEANNNLNIDIFEKNKPLKTLLYTGNGRCNLTNATFDYKELASNYPRGEKFLYSVFSRFGVKDTIDWFQQHGLELYTQDDKRVFPKSNNAETVRKILIDRAENLGINIKSNELATKISRHNGKFKVLTKSAQKNVDYDSVIIATGGNYRKPDESGYQLAKDLSHTITELRPALTAFVVKESWPKLLAGVTVKDVKISANLQDKQVYESAGDFVFTHKGVSGPLIFRISSYCAFLEYKQNEQLILKINFIPDKSGAELETEILTELEKSSKKNITTILKDYAPKSVIDVLLESVNISPDKKASQITRQDREKIIRLLSGAELSIISPQPEGEIVTAGGVILNEVDAKTMESKIVKNLYFCGEVLNIDGLTGGFNLQACWSGGYIAGVSIAKRFRPPE